MKKFTFGVISYNQEDFVIEHLESIKFQIQTFGKEWQCHLVFGDDGSSDRTVEYVKKWMEVNGGLFSDCTLLESRSNQGITHNYLSVLKNIRTERFKITAADDLYHSNSVFDIPKKNAFICTPVVKFKTDEGVIELISWQDRKLAHIGNKRFKNFCRNAMQYAQPFESPGVFWNWNHEDGELYNEIGRFKWNDDTPMFMYLLSQDKLKAGFCWKTAVLYRIGDGISSNINSVKNKNTRKEYQIEEDFINKNIYKKKNRFPKYLNPCYYKFEWEHIKYYFVMPQMSRIVKAFDNRQSKEIEKAKYHLAYLARQSEEFKKHRLKQEGNLDERK